MAQMFIEFASIFEIKWIAKINTHFHNNAIPCRPPRILESIQTSDSYILIGLDELNMAIYVVPLNECEIFSSPVDAWVFCMLKKSNSQQKVLTFLFSSDSNLPVWQFKPIL